MLIVIMLIYLQTRIMQWNQSSSVRSNSISHLSSVPSSTNTKRSQKSEDESMFDDGDFNSTCSEEVSFHHGLSPHRTDVSSSHTEVFSTCKHFS